MLLNKYGLYSLNAGMVDKRDFVDDYVSDLTKLREYSDVKEFLISKFGDISGEHWFEYPEIDKKIFVFLDETRAEFCALNHNRHYYGQGWKLIENNEKEN